MDFLNLMSDVIYYYEPVQVIFGSEMNGYGARYDPGKQKHYTIKIKNMTALEAIFRFIGIATAIWRIAAYYNKHFTKV